MRWCSILYPQKPLKPAIFVQSKTAYFPQFRNHLLIYHLWVVIAIYVLPKEEKTNDSSIANQANPYSYLLTVIMSLILSLWVVDHRTVLSGVMGVDRGIKGKSCFISNKYVFKKSRWSVQKALAKPFLPLVITCKQLMVQYHLEWVKS